MHLELSHYSAALVFAFFASIVFGITHKNTPRDMAKYGAYCFAWFSLGTIAAAWIMAGIRWLAMR